ncbi:MAG: HlyD family secretion protein [Candidatus Eremiobacteraeota bacterium]|nr:HlyD family secretion protein [Candidatus Eremiobacteraeota bacterium]
MEGTRQTTAAAPPAARRDGDSAAGDGVKTGPSPAVRLLLIVAATIVVLIALVFGIKYLAYATAHETTDDAAIDADEVQITSKISERVDRILVDTNVPVRRGQLLIQLDDLDERAKLDQARASVQAQQSQARAAQENVSLTSATQNAQNLQNTGSIAQANAGILSAAEQAKSAAGQIAVAQAAVAASRAQFKAAQDAIPGGLENLRKGEADLRRTTSLVSTGDVAASQLDSVRAEYEAARSQYAQDQAQSRAAAANLGESQQRLDAQRYATSSTQAQVGVQQAQLTTAQGHYEESDAPEHVSAEQAQADAANAQVASLQAQLLTAKINLGYTRILSPIDGYVGQKNTEIGQTVASGESLLTLIPANHVYVTANYKETQIGHMKVGQEVDISIDAYKGIAFIGHVDNLSPASQNKFSLVPAQNATGNFVKVTQRLPVRILVDRVEDHKLSDYPLRPGMSVETSVKVK